VKDELLGLSDEGNIEGDVPAEKLRSSDRVFVDVVQMNSKFYYVQGAVAEPGRFPCTGRETVLDALSEAGGLMRQADHQKAVLYRPSPPGTSAGLERLPVNVDEITVGGDPTTNYRIMPGDRLVIPDKPGAVVGEEKSSEDRSSASPARSNTPRGSQRAARQAAPGRDTASEDETRAPHRQVDSELTARMMLRLERRLSEVERKLDRLLEALEKRER
jgi:hypothetical protein